eukprot:6202161-Pleurochrysis_carterae.AAC.3
MAAPGAIPRPQAAATAAQQKCARRAARSRSTRCSSASTFDVTRKSRASWQRNAANSCAPGCTSHEGSCYCSALGLTKRHSSEHGFDNYKLACNCFALKIEHAKGGEPVQSLNQFLSRLPSGLAKEQPSETAGVAPQCPLPLSLSHTPTFAPSQCPSP